MYASYVQSGDIEILGGSDARRAAAGRCTGLKGNTFHIRSRKAAKGAKNRINVAALRLCAS